ncbi:hypothetical protein D3C87_1589470 [compost metagenome]
MKKIPQEKVFTVNATSLTHSQEAVASDMPLSVALCAPTAYELAAAWAEEGNENFAMLEAARKLAERSCPAACQIIQLVLDRMRDCEPEAALLNQLWPRDLH